MLDIRNYQRRKNTAYSYTYLPIIILVLCHDILLSSLPCADPYTFTNSIPMIKSNRKGKGVCTYRYVVATYSMYVRSTYISKVTLPNRLPNAIFGWAIMAHNLGRLGTAHSPPPYLNPIFNLLRCQSLLSISKVRPLELYLTLMIYAYFILIT